MTRFPDVWKETWFYNYLRDRIDKYRPDGLYDCAFLADVDELYGEATEPSEDWEKQAARAWLASQAPAMARMLVKIRDTYAPGADEVAEIQAVLDEARVTAPRFGDR
jgi:hypothetical protein